jgi:predicted MFS family arabinose efflux permease
MFGIVVMGIRWFVYSYSESFITLALWALTQGICMLAPYYYCMRYTAQITPPEGSTTIQTINFIVFSGVSRAVGSLLGGIVLQVMDYRTVYFYCGIICMITAAIFLFSRTKFEKLV